MKEQMTVIPDFLLEMSKQMHQQDNRATSHPVWVVCYDDYITCADGRGDHVELIDATGRLECPVLYTDRDCDATELVEHIQEYYPEQFNAWYEANKVEWPDRDAASIAEHIDDAYAYVCDLGIDDRYIERIEVQRVVREVTCCLTEADANAFIKRKQHDYSKLYTYVKSMVFCPQMIELREWILSLTEPEEANQ
jgi:hypothetical protein